MRNRRGSATLEFTLVGIPLIFAIISVFEMSRGMWNYHTLAQAVKVAARYASVHGQECYQDGNSCGIEVKDVANKIATWATGVPANTFNVTLTSNSSSVPCNPLSSCLSNATSWPPASDYQEGLPIEISASYPFQSALAMFWPGSHGVTFATTTFPAYSRQIIQF